MLGNLLADLGRRDEAIASYSRALAIKPGPRGVALRKGSTSRPRSAIGTRSLLMPI